MACKVVENILFVLRNVGEQVLWVAVVHFVLMKCSDFYLVGVLPVSSLLPVFLLLELDSYGLRVGERLGIKFVVAEPLFWGLIGLKVVSEVEAVLIASLLFATAKSLMPHILSLRFPSEIMRRLPAVIVVWFFFCRL
jgi:hypothetical protein